MVSSFDRFVMFKFSSRLREPEIHQGKPSRGSSLPTSLWSHIPSFSTSSSPSSAGFTWLLLIVTKTSDRSEDKLQTVLITICPSVSVPHHSFKGHCQRPWMLHCCSLDGAPLRWMTRWGKATEEKKVGKKRKALGRGWAAGYLNFL